ncbi:MAG TPA: hypothetical protein VHF06_14155 [Pseudonocardiaceae bacterium]|nr:hypothetical protein [Pseudonocardiaceae bacterium]
MLYDAVGGRSSVRDLRFTDPAYPTEVFNAALAGCDLAVLTNTAFTRGLIPVAAERRVPIATDVHLVTDIDTCPHRDWLFAADILACSHERLPVPPAAWIERLWQRLGTDVVLVGCGAGGALVGARAARAIWHVAPTTPRGLRYTSGAGDTLLAAFVHHYLLHGDPVLALRSAVLASGWKVGGRPAEGPGVEPGALVGLALPEATRLS